MHDPVQDGTALMVLRVWTDADDRLRVRITASPGLDAAGTVTTYAATPAEVLARVRDWLDLVVTSR
jgi:hypothetical protein